MDKIYVVFFHCYEHWEMITFFTDKDKASLYCAIHPECEWQELNKNNEAIDFTQPMHKRYNLHINKANLGICKTVEETYYLGDELPNEVFIDHPRYHSWFLRVTAKNQQEAIEIGCRIIDDYKKTRM